MDIEQHVDAPIHLVILGVTKTMVKKIMEWTKQKNKRNSFVCIASGILDSIAKLHLDWCCNTNLWNENWRLGIGELPSVSKFVSVVFFYIANFAARSRIQGSN
jgi:hypothetical protein